MNNGYASPSSSPPSSPPSPLPISVGPDQQNYFFSSSPSLLNNSSAENLPLLHEKTTFSLDHPRPHEPVPSPSCLRDLVEWLLLRCCNCCSWSLSEPRRITDI